jgi:hypothetical protein
MSNVHWFDTVSKRLVQASSRRQIARSLSALLPGIALAGLAGTADAKNGGKRGGKKHRGGNKKHKKNSGGGDPGSNPNDPGPGGSGGGSNDPSPVGPPDICDLTWSDSANRDYCKFVRGECSGDNPEEFCIITNFPGKTGENVAVCCIEGLCCGSECCPYNGPGWKCCQGTCANTDRNDTNCGVCGNQCPIGQVCYQGHCENRACSGALDCPPGMPCINGECTCGTYHYCFHPDLGHGVCFSGECSLLK